MTPGNVMKEQPTQEGPRRGEELSLGAAGIAGLGLQRCEGPAEMDLLGSREKPLGSAHVRGGPQHPLPQITMLSLGPRGMHGAQEQPGPPWGPPYCWSWCGPFPPW